MANRKYKHLFLSGLITVSLLGAYSQSTLAAEEGLPSQTTTAASQAAPAEQAPAPAEDQGQAAADAEPTAEATPEADQAAEDQADQAAEELTAQVGNQEVAVSYEKPEVAPVEQSNDPDRIATTIPSDPSSEMAFNWYTKDALEDAHVIVSEHEDLSDGKRFEAQQKGTQTNHLERDQDGNVIYELADYDEEGRSVYFTDDVIAQDNHDWTGGAYSDGASLQPVMETINKAKATGLKANTTYYYRLGATGHMSPLGTFKTAAAGQDPFKFVHYTDTQNAFWNENARNEAAFGAQTLNEALAVAGDADFALHTGDIVEVSAVEDEWKDIMNQSQAGYLNVAHTFVPGNHDTYKTSYVDHLNVPITNSEDAGTYYSYDYNGSHFVVLNTNDNQKDADNPNGAALSNEQLSWLDNDLADARQRGVNWLVVTYHKPLYSSSYHSLQDADVQAVREDLITILDKHDVDLVLNGHDHVLTTTKPLVANIDVFSDGAVDKQSDLLTDDQGREFLMTDGTMFVIPNAAGTKLYDDIYNAPLEHIHKVRPKLSHMTQEDLDYYRSLFDRSDQPGDSPYFENSHSNNRESSTQNFGVYTVTPDELRIDLYQVEGNVLDAETPELRQPKLIASYSLINDQFDLAAHNADLAENNQAGNEEAGNQEGDQVVPPVKDEEANTGKEETPKGDAGKEDTNKADNTDTDPEATVSGKAEEAGNHAKADQDPVVAVVEAAKADQADKGGHKETAGEKQADKEVKASSLPATGQEATPLTVVGSLLAGLGLIFTFAGKKKVK
ncbi:metallophosphoesterase [Aerococcus kribbianus]|uniref:Fibronectin type III domain-containing protein n=1 Tax=Aerococcus kribbianus TaxID=2999064 RepID=A0A9X3FRR1_9LACT|nr:MULTISPECIES: metallophosphoesterase [unclassified Aerococcus]MCZ0717167.1 fibronectin type III domain-containing protein [Aerococcus sp. YH-aer221]MCZ0725455.1 fibronectin type III domain-containing protein [Aerococcus sp. YH-aer222]